MANERRYRETEQRLWSSVGLTPVEHQVPLASGTTVRIQEFGDGPPIVFIHGGSSSGANWAPLLPELGDFRCLVIDRPGCGLSEPIAGGDGYGTIAEFERFTDSLVANVLDALELPSAAVAATSLGGFYALRGAAAHPERVTQLVLFGFSIGAKITKIPTSMRLATIPGLQAMMMRIPPTRGAVKMILRQLGLKQALNDGRASEELLDWFVSLLRDTDSMRNELKSAPNLISPIAGQHPALILGADVLSKITMPALFMWGDGDPIGGADVARTFTAQFPDATLELFADASHAPWIDEPKRSADLTRSFLASQRR